MGLYEIKKMTTLRDELRLIQAKALEEQEKATQVYMPLVRSILTAEAKQGKSSCQLYRTDIQSTTIIPPDVSAFGKIVTILKKEGVDAALHQVYGADSCIKVSWE